MNEKGANSEPMLLLLVYKASYTTDAREERDGGDDDDGMEGKHQGQRKLCVCRQVGREVFSSLGITTPGGLAHGSGPRANGQPRQCRAVVWQVV